MIQPIEFIETLRETDNYIKDIYMNGGCYQFHLLLKKLYPQAEPYIDENKWHVITEINGDFYDITGIVDPTGFKSMTYEDHLDAKEWSFYQNNLLMLDECDYCGSPYTREPKSIL